jgi:hypothetical protein
MASGLTLDPVGNQESEYTMANTEYNSVWVTCGKLSINILTLDEGLVRVSAYPLGKECEDALDAVVLRQPD